MQWNVRHDATALMLARAPARFIDGVLRSGDDVGLHSFCSNWPNVKWGSEYCSAVRKQPTGVQARCAWTLITINGKPVYRASWFPSIPIECSNAEKFQDIYLTTYNINELGAGGGVDVARLEDQLRAEPLAALFDHDGAHVHRARTVPLASISTNVILSEVIVNLPCTEVLTDEDVGTLCKEFAALATNHESTSVGQKRARGLPVRAYRIPSALSETETQAQAS